MPVPCPYLAPDKAQECLVQRDRNFKAMQGRTWERNPCESCAEGRRRIEAAETAPPTAPQSKPRKTVKIIGSEDVSWDPVRARFRDRRSGPALEKVADRPQAPAPVIPTESQDIPLNPAISHVHPSVLAPSLVSATIAKLEDRRARIDRTIARLRRIA